MTKDRESTGVFIFGKWSTVILMALLYILGTQSENGLDFEFDHSGHQPDDHVHPVCLWDVLLEEGHYGWGRLVDGRWLDRVFDQAV